MAGNHVQLSRRLKAIADMVTEGNRLVDVGCDHGYLPVYLMLNHKIPGAIATDVERTSWPGHRNILHSMG
mgnify:CR=1 FL=1